MFKIKKNVRHVPLHQIVVYSCLKIIVNLQNPVGIQVEPKHLPNWTAVHVQHQGGKKMLLNRLLTQKCQCESRLRMCNSMN